MFTLSINVIKCNSNNYHCKGFFELNNIKYRTPAQVKQHVFDSSGLLMFLRRQDIGETFVSTPCSFFNMQSRLSHNKMEKLINFSQNICMSQLFVIMDIYRSGVIYRYKTLFTEKVSYFVKNKFSY